MTRLKFYFVLAAGAWLSIVDAHAVNYFRWDAESGGDNFLGATSRDCSVAHLGSCSMRLQIVGNDSGNQQLGVGPTPFDYPFQFVNGPALYYRWWMRIEPGFSWGNGTTKTKASRTIGGPLVNGSGAQGYTGYLQSFGFLIGECGSAGCRLADGSVNTDENLYIPYNFRSRADGLWHEYIVKIKPNTSATCTAGVNCDAQFQAWVDGVSVGEYNNFKLHSDANHILTEGWGGWMLTPYFQLNGTVSDGGVIYIDDVSTDSQFNSLTGPRPNPPSGLQVQ